MYVLYFLIGLINAEFFQCFFSIENSLKISTNMQKIQNSSHKNWFANTKNCLITLNEQMQILHKIWFSVCNNISLQEFGIETKQQQKKTF